MQRRGVSNKVEEIHFDKQLVRRERRVIYKKSCEPWLEKGKVIESDA
jgi:hypothetical protein